MPTAVILVCDAVVSVPTKLVAPKLPTLALPLTLNVPVMFAPVAVTNNTLAVPATVIAILLLAVIAILLLPDA